MRLGCRWKGKVGDIKYIFVLLLIIFIGFFNCCNNPKSEALEWNNKGIEVMAMSPEQAIQYYDKALSIEPAFTTARSNKIKALWSIDKNAEALYEAKKQHAIENTTFTSMELATAYEKVGLVDSAANLYRELLREKPPVIVDSSVDITARLAQLITVAHGKEQGLKFFNSWQTNYPIDDEYLSEDEETYWKTKNSINHYQGGGMQEFELNGEEIALCIPDSVVREDSKRWLLENGVNFSYIIYQGQEILFRTSKRYQQRAEELGLLPCD